MTHSFDVTDSYVPPWAPADANEATLLGAILAGDDASREVYADWLEERGDAARADLLRVQERLQSIAPIDPAFDATLRELRTLEGRVDPVWRKRIERPLEIPFSVEFPLEQWARSAPLPTPAPAPPPAPRIDEARLVAKRLRPRPITPREIAFDVPEIAVDSRPIPFRFLSAITGGAVLLVMVLHWLGVIG